nr:glycosyltransferase 61 family protein [uncultured Rhodopila sp.]
MKIDFSKAADSGRLIVDALNIGGVSAVSPDGISITIHPNGKQRASVRVLVQRPSCQPRMGAIFTNPHPNAAAVKFSIILYDGQGGFLTETSVNLGGGESGSVFCNLSRPVDDITIELSTEMLEAGASTDSAWARFDWVQLDLRDKNDVIQLMSQRFEEIPKASALDLSARFSQWSAALGMQSGPLLISDCLKYSLIPCYCPNHSRLSPVALRTYLDYMARPFRDTAPIHLYAFSDALHFPYGVMLVDGKIVAETLLPVPPPYLDRVNALWRLSRTHRLEDRQPPIDKPVLVLPQPGEANYGHWLIEMMPKVSPLISAIIRGEVQIGLSEVQTSTPVIMETLAHLGISSSQVLTLPDYPIKLRKALYISPVSKHSHPGYVTPWSVETLSEYVSAVNPGKTGRKLFISRQDASFRFLSNEGEIVDIVSAAGYECLSTGGMSFIEQVELFKGASHIIGVFGASLSNIAFSEAGTKLLVLAPSYFFDHFYWNLASLRQMAYWQLIGSTEPDAYSQTQGRSDFTIDLDEFRKLFAEFSAF